MVGLSKLYSSLHCYGLPSINRSSPWCLFLTRKFHIYDMSHHTHASFACIATIILFHCTMVHLPFYCIMAWYVCLFDSLRGMSCHVHFFSVCVCVCVCVLCVCACVGVGVCVHACWSICKVYLSVFVTCVCVHVSTHLCLHVCICDPLSKNLQF